MTEETPEAPAPAPAKPFIPQQRQHLAPHRNPVREAMPDEVPDWAVVAGVIVGIVVAVVAAVKGLPRLIHWTRHSPWLNAWLHTVIQPTHAYLVHHTVGLPVNAATAYLIWAGVGFVAGLVAMLTRANGARLTWTVWGAATGWMVWCAAPATGRDVALGLTVIAWTSLSTLALRGLSWHRRR